jgi:hypothetical protein
VPDRACAAGRPSARERAREQRLKLAVCGVVLLFLSGGAATLWVGGALLRSAVLQALVRAASSAPRTGKQP